MSFTITTIRSLLEADKRFTDTQRRWEASGSDEDLFNLLNAYRRTSKDIPDAVWEAYNQVAFRQRDRVTRQFLKEYDTLVKVLKRHGINLLLSEPYDPKQYVNTDSPYTGRIIGRNIEWLHHASSDGLSGRRVPWIWAHRSMKVSSATSIGSTNYKGKDDKSLGYVTLSYSAEGNEWYRISLWKGSSVFKIAAAWNKKNKVEDIIKRAILALPGHKKYGHPMDGHSILR